MTEWEQMKKEYREIPIPTNGPGQLLETMADAKRKRNRIKQVSRYATAAAAALLAIVVLPRMQLFSGGADTSSESAVMESGGITAEGTASDTWFDYGDADDNTTESVNMAPASGNVNTAMDATGATVAPEAIEESKVNFDGSNKEKQDYCEAVNEKKLEADGINIGLTKQDKEAISEEILRQMEERIQKEGDTYYIKSEDCPKGFEVIADGQSYYINEMGLLVVVFEAGSVAPETEGVIEFVIPREIFSVEE